MLKLQLRRIIDVLNEKILLDIMRIKNPNELLYELIKVFFLILNRSNNNLSWIFMQAHLSNFNIIKKDLEDLIEREISSEIKELGMPFYKKYHEFKISLIRINKHLIIILDLVKCIIDYNLKKNLVKDLFQNNINVKKEFT